MAQEAGTRWKSMVGALLAGGVAGVFLAPIVGPALSRLLRPATKAALKSGMALYQRGRETAAELREAIEDASAEIAAGSAAEPTSQVQQQAPAPTAAKPARRAGVH